MALTFADVIQEQSSQRFFMVRLTPARNIGSMLTSVGGGVYQMSWSRPVARLERNGMALTKVSSVSADDDWSYDEALGVIQVKLASAPSDTSNIICLFFYLFMTSGLGLLANENPMDSATPIRLWEPRIQTPPVIKQSIRNALSGIFSIDDSSVTLANGDSYFGQFLADTDSFSEKDADIWAAVRTTNANNPEFERIYRGKAKGLTIGSSGCSITLYDSFSRLSQPCYMGDDPAQCIVQQVSASWPSADPNAVGRVVPYFIGRFSRYQTRPLPPLYGSLKLDTGAMPEAFCSSYDQAVGTTTNRTWVLGRVSADGLRSWSMPGAPTGVFSNGQFSIFSFTTSAFDAVSADITIGDLVKISYPALTDYYGRIVRIDSRVGISPTFHSEITVQTNATSTPAWITASSVSFTALTDPAIIISDGSNDYVAFPGVDYTTTLTTTTGGNKLISISFNSDFETNRTLWVDGGDSTWTPGLGTLDPGQHHVFFRIRPSVTNYGKHGDVLKQIMTLVGLMPLATTFTAADSTLPVNLAMQIPAFDESSYGAYLDYVQKILDSTLGILALDTSDEVNYSLLSAPSSSDNTDANVLGGLAVTIDYQDIVSQIIAYNPHNSSAAAISASPSPSETRSSLVAQYLHGIVNSMQFVHVLETITDRIDMILAARSNRKATYSFDVASKFLDAKIGDDTLLKHQFLLGSDLTRAAKIFSLDKSASRVSVQACDLLGVS